MREAIRLADESVKNGGGPFGAVIVKDGEIVERGTHEELVGAGGVYTELYETQFKKGLSKNAEK